MAQWDEVLANPARIPRREALQFNKTVPPADLLYVGWTEPGEWFNITVDVTHAGTYAADFLDTSNRGGTISIDVNGTDATGPCRSRQRMIPQTRWPGVNGTIGIWPRNCSKFISARARMFSPSTYLRPNLRGHAQTVARRRSTISAIRTVPGKRNGDARGEPADSQLALVH
jgi:hypothetical protein